MVADHEGREHSGGVTNSFEMVVNPTLGPDRRSGADLAQADVLIAIRKSLATSGSTSRTS
jgi:hypothetical protein